MFIQQMDAKEGARPLGAFVDCGSCLSKRGLVSVPHEVYLQILSFLEPRDLCVFALVNRFCHQLSSDNVRSVSYITMCPHLALKVFWKNLTCRSFPFITRPQILSSILEREETEMSISSSPFWKRQYQSASHLEKNWETGNYAILSTPRLQSIYAVYVRFVKD